MNKKDYQKIYEDFLLSFYQTEIVSRLGLITLKNYPNNLPDKTRDVLLRDKHEMMKLIVQSGSLKNSGKTAASPVESRNNDLQTMTKTEEDMMRLGFGELFIPSLMAETTLAKQGHLNGYGPQNLHFDRIVNSQRLAMHYAYLDAFMGDSLRAVLTLQPLLTSEEKVDAKVVLGLGSWDAVIQYLIETYVYRVGWKTITERISFFKERLGLDLKINDELLGTLRDGEQLRNMIIHNAGRVNSEYKKRSKNNDIKIGEIIPIDDKYMRKVIGAIEVIAGDIRRQINIKFFKDTDEKLLPNSQPV